jgi:peptidoglycan-N-acetylglucosamine deacetylase
MLDLLAVPAAAGLSYLFCYGGFEGPIDWAMGTITHGSRDSRRVALTFDDGPDPDHTPAVLDVLAAAGAKATFFVLGERVERHPAIVERIVAEGHELGNHTFHHRYLPLVRSRTVTAELARTDAAIAAIIGTAPTLARPPYGGRSPRNVQAFTRAGKQLVLWDVNSFDWQGKPAEAVAARVVERTRPGSIVLMHDICPHTPAALHLVIDGLAARDFALDTVSGLL